MKVFSVAGRLKQDDDDFGSVKFDGFFSLDENSSEIKGSLKEFFSQHEENRFIYGKYDESSSRMAFFIMTNSTKLSPILCVFSNLREEGIWSAYYLPDKGFFPSSEPDGNIEIILKANSKSSNEVIEEYDLLAQNITQLNEELIKSGVDYYTEGLDIAGVYDFNYAANCKANSNHNSYDPRFSWLPKYSKEFDNLDDDFEDDDEDDDYDEYFD